MKIFNAIDDPNIVPMFFNRIGIKLNIMISYAYQKGSISKLTKKYRDMIHLLYLDSGAYSVYTGRKKISLFEYTIFLKKYGDFFNERFSLDDRFDDADHNLQNQLDLEEALKAKSWKPIPVLHDFKDPYKEFELYRNNDHSYIAIGSMGADRKIPNEILDRIVANHPEVKLHFFGDLNVKRLIKYRPYSADSASWAHTAGAGDSINYWRSSENKSYTFKVGTRDSTVSHKNHIKKSPFLDEIIEFLRDKFDYGYEEILNDSQKRWIVNLYYYVQLENYINSLGAIQSTGTGKGSKKKAGSKRGSKAAK